ncbi:metal ABC transporter solute-binding protein, Zn/Mn family [Thalassobacillus hwangdonensis]|uniref:Metal ABC transporter solute-binding protein, Zn/Mn family n=1 Tax=Thalassobacillus hwangdonensis TaxID=546108 RepID=A0ABW3L442_9BACI
MKNKSMILAILLIFTMFLAACGEETASSSSEQDGVLKIYTTVYPLQDFAEKIGGRHVDVESILPPGADAHNYEPDTKQMIELAEADAFIMNGAGMEAYAGKIAESIETEDVKILEAAEGIDLKHHTHNLEDGEGENHDEEGHEHEEEETHGEDDHGEEGHEHEEEAHGEDDHGEEEGHDHEEDTHADENADDHAGHDHDGEDPHVWLDPMKSIQLAENIKEQLVELKPEEKETFEANFEKLKTDLQALDEDFHTTLEAQKKNKIIVSHAAYGYWEEAYGIEQIAVSGLSPSDEPSQKDLEKIIDAAEEHGLKHVMFEQNVTPKIAELIQKEIDGDALRIHNLSVLTDAEIEAEEDYFSLMRKNLNVLKEALGE